MSPLRGTFCGHSNLGSGESLGGQLKARNVIRAQLLSRSCDDAETEALRGPLQSEGRSLRWTGWMDWHAFAILCAVSMSEVAVNGAPAHLTGRRCSMSYALGAKKRAEVAVVLADPDRAGTGGGAGSSRGHHAPHGSPADVLRDSLGGGAGRASGRVGPFSAEPRWNGILRLTNQLRSSLLRSDTVIGWRIGA